MNKLFFFQLISFFFSYLFRLIQTKKNLRNSINPNNDNSKLLFVWEHFRHGARGPWISVDPVTGLDFIGEKWTGEGELTSLGIRMNYLLGVSMKKRYEHFLSKQFNPNEIYIISTDVNRTMMSSYAQLQGMYNNLTTSPLTQKQNNISKKSFINSNYSDMINDKINNELKYNSIQNGVNLFPVHLYPNDYGKEFLLYEPDICPGIVKYREKAQNSETMKKIYLETSERLNKTFGEYIFKFMNISGEEDPYYLWNTTNMYYIGDTFISDYTDGREMKLIRDTHIDMEAFYRHSLNLSSLETYFGYFGNPLEITCYLQMSPVFRSIFNFMDMRIDLDKKGESDKIISQSPRFVMVAGHDTTLGANDLFLKEEFRIEYEHAVYCSNQIYELWKNDTNGKYSIKYLVNQELKAEFDYEEFKEKVLKKIYTEKEVNEICDGIKEEEKNENNIFKIIFFVCLGLAFIGLLVLGFVLFIEKNPNIKIKIKKFC